MIYSRGALDDLERVGEFLDGIEVPARHPLMGRPVEHGMRELVVSRGRTGYLVLYELIVEEDIALVLAIRHQRETGYEE